MGLLFAACGSSGAGGPCLTTNEAPEVELGTGVEDGHTFAPLAPDGPIPLTFGQQQGFHVWTHLRARNLCFRQLTLRRTATLVETGEVITTSREQLSLVAASDAMLAARGWGELPSSLPTFLCPHLASRAMPGSRVEVKVELHDLDGRGAEVRKTVVPFCPNTVRATCEYTCASSVPDGGAGG